MSRKDHVVAWLASIALVLCIGGPAVYVNVTSERTATEGTECRP